MQHLHSLLRRIIEDSFPVFTKAPKERLENRDTIWVPGNEEDFYCFMNSASPQDLYNMGFEIWDTYNNMAEGVAKERQEYDIYNMLVGVDPPPENAISKPLEVDKILFLFPGEWFDILPKGFEVMTIEAVLEPFNSELFYPETRFGCLPYGIMEEMTPEVCKWYNNNIEKF